MAEAKDKSGAKVKFIRKNGRVIPVRSDGSKGSKPSSKSKKRKVNSEGDLSSYKGLNSKKSRKKAIKTLKGADKRTNSKLKKLDRKANKFAAVGAGVAAGLYAGVKGGKLKFGDLVGHALIGAVAGSASSGTRKERRSLSNKSIGIRTNIQALRNLNATSVSKK